MSEPRDLVPTLASFSPALRVLVWGASGGIGGAFVAALEANPRVATVMAALRKAASPWRFDLEDEASIAAVAAKIRSGGQGTSGSPMVSSITSRPSRFIWRAAA